jgi:hypothetical protein
MPSKPLTGTVVLVVCVDCANRPPGHEAEDRLATFSGPPVESVLAVEHDHAWHLVRQSHSVVIRWLCNPSGRQWQPSICLTCLVLHDTLKPPVDCSRRLPRPGIHSLECRGV